MIKKYLFFLSLLILALPSCTDDTSLEEIGPFVRLGAAPVISEPVAGASFTFTEENADQQFTPISWSAADFGYQAAITYEVQVDQVGNNFTNPVSLGLVNGLSLNTVTVGTINSLLFAQGYPDSQPLDMEMRIVATVSDEVEPLISASIPLTMTLYEVIIIYPQLHLPGDYQGWDPATETNIIFSLKSNKVYEGFNYFGQDDAVFKFTDGPSWDLNWGDVEPDGILDEGGVDNNIPIGGPAGVYMLNCNINTLTYEVTATNWGVVGDATPGGWDTDTALTYDEENNTLTTTLDLSAGALKFRANGVWEINLGDNDANGKLQFGGSDIIISEAGNYTIRLNILNVAEYNYELIKN